MSPECLAYGKTRKAIPVKKASMDLEKANGVNAKKRKNYGNGRLTIQCASFVETILF